MNAAQTPLLVTAGEAAGIGPELCVRLATQRSNADFAVLACPDQLRVIAEQLAPELSVVSVDLNPDDWPERSRQTLFVVPLDYPADIVPGRPDPRNAPVMLDGLGRAVDACLDKRFRAIVTAPLQKSAVNEAGIPFSGHTEFLAERTGGTAPVMLLTAGKLRVALATTHLPLREVPDAISAAGLDTVLRILHAELIDKFAVAAPRIVVCGLNPHAGEGGHLGREDAGIIKPAVDALCAEGMHIVGPLPADTAFTPAAGHADAVLAMYHDQGLPVLKYAGFGNAVNVTLGLPIVRTSVDHGTALDIAGSGNADVGSLLAAFDLANRISAGTEPGA